MAGLIETDLRHVWHPTSQMKDYESFPPLEVVKARGSYITLADGRRVLDAISSWWCKCLGHGHPRIQAAIQHQIQQFEHVILANTTYESVALLAQKLSTLTAQLDRVFFAGDGACAVEIAIKMALQAQQLRGCPERTELMALGRGYHGETLLASAVTHVSLYKKPYESMLPEVSFLTDIPYVFSRDDPLWEDCSLVWEKAERYLDQKKDRLALIIIEPIVQGASGMHIYAQDFLKRLRHWCTKQQVFLIADEITTGCGRTGKPLACHHAGVEPDFICLGKGLTAGWLPLTAVLTTTDIYQMFYDDYETNKAFLHSHTYSGNALGCAVAFETLNILEEEGIYQKVQEEEAEVANLMNTVSDATGRLKNIRHIGALVAADLDFRGGLVDPNQRWGYHVYQNAVQLGALLRPIGNTLYWLTPLNIQRKDLIKLRDITIQAIDRTFGPVSK